MTAAGIVVYNPDYQRLVENLDRTSAQVDTVYVFSNDQKSYESLEGAGGVVILSSDGENHGVAYAYNRIVERAAADGIEWCLLLDQDSLIPENMISEYELAVTNQGNHVTIPAIISPRIVDKRNHTLISETGDAKNLKFAITSGSYVNTGIWQELGGYEEALFIDLVDQIYCAKVRHAGYRIHRVDTVTMEHELGTVENNDEKHEGKLNELTNKSKLQIRDPYEYSAFRRYYITRNRIVASRMYPGEAEFRHPYLKAIKRAIAVVLYENDKGNKLSAIARGIMDGRQIRL